jgi:hypothetical protein
MAQPIVSFPFLTICFQMWLMQVKNLPGNFSHLRLSWTSQNQFAHAKPPRCKGTKIAGAILVGFAALREIFVIQPEFRGLTSLTTG